MAASSVIIRRHLPEPPRPFSLSIALPRRHHPSLASSKACLLRGLPQPCLTIAGAPMHGTWWHLSRVVGQASLTTTSHSSKALLPPLAEPPLVRDTRTRTRRGSDRITFRSQHLLCRRTLLLLRGRALRLVMVGTCIPTPLRAKLAVGMAAVCGTTARRPHRWISAPLRPAVLPLALLTPLSTAAALTPASRSSSQSRLCRPGMGT